MPIKKSAAKPASETSKNRVRNRAKAAAQTVQQPSASQDSNRAIITPAIEIEPTATPIIDRVTNHAPRRAKAATIMTCEQPDAFIVDFLPDFLIDHRSDTGASRIPCGEVTGIGGVREEIQARFMPKLGEGYYRITPRINGKITKGQWIEYVEPSISSIQSSNPDEDGEWFSDEELNSADELTPKFFKLTIENERLKARLDAQRETPKSNGLGDAMTNEVLKQVLLEKLKPVDPVEKIFATIRAVQENAALLMPKAPNPAPATQPQRSDEEMLLSAIARNPDVMEKVTGGIFKKLLGDSAASDEASWADVAREAMQSGQAAKIVEAAFVGLGSLFSPFMPGRAEQQPTQAPPTQQPQPTPTVEPVDSAQIASDRGGEIASQRVIGRVLSAMAMNAAVEPVISAIDGFRILFPEQQPMIESWMTAPAENVLQFLGQNVQGAAEVVSQPHALAWLQKLQAAYLADDADMNTEESEQPE